jgi:hypothetical protein
MAIASPTGRAMSAETTVMISVPDTSGRTPKVSSPIRGLQSVPVM